MDGRGGHSLANVQGQPCRSITPKNMKKPGEESSGSRFRVCLDVCLSTFPLSWGSLVGFFFISKARLAADFADLLRLEVGWKLVHRRHCGSTYGLSPWQGKVLATLEMKMTVTCCAETLLLTSHWDQLGELQVNLANQDATCILPTPFVSSCFRRLPGGWEPWDPQFHGDLIRPDGRRRRGCKVNWKNLTESCWSLNAKHRFQANVVKHKLDVRSISWSLLIQWQPYWIDWNMRYRCE